MTSHLVVAFDLGKTTTRASLGGRPDLTFVSDGASGLGETQGPATAIAQMCAALDPAMVEQHIRTQCRPDTSVTVSVAAAGASSSPANAMELASSTSRLYGGADVAVCSDVIAAHAGAFRGDAGVVLSAGTGAVAVGLDARDRRFRRADGWGQWLGDEGSATWIGRAGLSAALRDHDGRGPRTRLTARAVDRFGDLSRIGQALALTDPGCVAATASFSHDVGIASADGDECARHIVTEAARLLASTALAAFPDPRRRYPVAVVGGLTRLPGLLDLIDAELGDSVTLQEPRGSALDGAALIGSSLDLPHEAHVHRLGASH